MVTVRGAPGLVEGAAARCIDPGRCHSGGDLLCGPTRVTRGRRMQVMPVEWHGFITQTGLRSGDPSIEPLTGLTAYNHFTTR